MRILSLLYTALLMLCLAACGGGPGAPDPDEECPKTINVYLNDGGYYGYWVPGGYYLVIGIFADAACQDPLVVTYKTHPDVDPAKVLLGITREWPDEVWILPYVTRHLDDWWHVHPQDYCPCDGPYYVPMHAYGCDAVADFHYPGFGSACFWN